MGMTRREFLESCTALTVLAVLPIPALDQTGPFTISGWIYPGEVPADVAVWEVALTKSEITALSKGVSVFRIRPSSLVSYVPGYRISTPNAGQSVHEWHHAWGYLDGHRLSHGPTRFAGLIA